MKGSLKNALAVGKMKYAQFCSSVFLSPYFAYIDHHHCITSHWQCTDKAKYLCVWVLTHKEILCFICTIPVWCSWGGEGGGISVHLHLMFLQQLHDSCALFTYMQHVIHLFA